MYFSEHHCRTVDRVRARFVGMLLIVFGLLGVFGNGALQESFAQVEPFPAIRPTSPARSPMPGSDGTPMPMPTPPGTTSPPANGSSSIPQDILYLPDAEGKLKPVPLNVTLEQYLEWLDQRDSQSNEAQAEWQIKSLSGQGTLKVAADGSPWTKIDFQLVVDVAPSPRWNSLPLMLGEGLLAGLSDTEEQTASSQLMVTRDLDSGQWLLWYRNRKAFTVNLELLVPIRVVGEEKHLLLTMPIASKTELGFQFEQRDLEYQLLSRGFWEKEENDQGALIRLAGFQQAIDLRWSPARSQAESAPIMNVDSRIELMRSSESTIVSARQTINVDRGQVSSIRVKLPSGFQVDTVTADVSMKYALEAADPSAITLNFAQPVQKSVQIDWRLSSPIRRFESQILLDGFAVRGARTETGKIGIAKSNEWRIVQIPERSENIYLMNVRDFPAMGEYAKSFRYYGQPYRLALNTQRTELQYNHSAHYQLHFTNDTLKLTADFTLSPRNSVLDAIRLDWPDLNAGQWIPERITRQSTGAAILWQIEGDDKLLLPLDNLEGREVIRLEASRRIPPVAQAMEQKSALPLSLPFISSTDATPQERIVRICNSVFQPWEATLREDLNESYRLRGVSSELLVRPLYQQFSEQEVRSHWYQLPPTGDQWELYFRPVDQQLLVEHASQLERIDLINRRLLVKQRVEFQVSQIPADRFILEDRGTQEEWSQQLIRFTDEQGNELIPALDEGAEPGPMGGAAFPEQLGTIAARQTRRFQFTTSRPILGKYSLIAFRSLPLPENAERDLIDLLVPQLNAPGARELPFRFSNVSPFLVELTDRQWKLANADESAQSWQAEQSGPEIPVRIHPLKPRRATQTGPVAAEVQTWLAGNGERVSEMTFHISRMPPAFAFSPASQFALLTAYWKPLDSARPEYPHELRDGDQTTLLFDDTVIGQAGRLVVTVREPRGNAPASLLETTVRLPAHSLDQELTIVHWNLNTPQGIYLWNPPAGLNAAYQWTWQGLGFRRTPVDARRANLIGSGSSTAGVRPHYEFTHVGWPREARVRLIGRGLLMTFGAGIPILLAGLLSGRGSAYQLRAMLLMTLLAVIVAVQFPEPFLVILQPALLGTSFVLMATLVARRLRTRHDEPTLIIVGPAAREQAGDSEVMNFSDHGVGADDITQVQAPRKAMLESSH